MADDKKLITPAALYGINSIKCNVRNWHNCKKIAAANVSQTNATFPQHLCKGLKRLCWIIDRAALINMTGFCGGGFS